MKKYIQLFFWSPFGRKSFGKMLTKLKIFEIFRTSRKVTKWWEMTRKVTGSAFWGRLSAVLAFGEISWGPPVSRTAMLYVSEGLWCEIPCQNAHKTQNFQNVTKSHQMMVNDQKSQWECILGSFKRCFRIWGGFPRLMYGCIQCKWRPLVANPLTKCSQNSKCF